MASGRTRGKGKTSAVLARRKAALERAASRMAEQRREAQEAEAQRLRREAAFDELVADFELAVEDEAAAVAEVEEEVARVRERGRVRIDAAKVAAARVVWAMGEAGETVAGCGQRLGVGVERIKELRRLGRERLAAGGSQAALGRVEADARGKATVPEGTAGGPDGEQPREGGGGAGRVGAVLRGSGVAPVAASSGSSDAAARSAPPAAPPSARSAPSAAPPGVALPGAPAGPSGVPGGGGGAQPGWPESSR
ncbi:hypothetical protein [Streptomyces sp. NPDC007904]|uniref:hypothetical protein n=1 Tax=Streptomyces sp. NPDC007904 TaxID=3364787 RepID=UPI0036E06360